MRFEIAISSLKYGCRIQRKAWNEGFLAFDYEDIFSVKKQLLYICGEIRTPYILTQEDYSSTDWEVLDVVL